MAFYAFLGLSLYIFIKKYPGQSHSLLSHANSFIKFMPIDRESGNLLGPLLSYSANIRKMNNHLKIHLNIEE